MENRLYGRKSNAITFKKGMRFLLFCLILVSGLASIIGSSGDTPPVSFSNPAPYDTPATSAPASPANVSAIPGDRQVTLTWDPVSDATSYNIYWSWGSAIPLPNNQILRVSSPYTHTGLINGTAFHYVITAKNNWGESDASNQVSATPEGPLLYSQTGSSWTKTYGGTGFEKHFDHSICQTTDGGYIVAGSTTSFNSGNDTDIFVLKIDTNGDVVWQKTYGGTLNDEAHSIQQISGGGYIVAGHTYSFGAGNNDIWVLRLDGDGDVLWQKAYGGSDFDSADSIQQTSDGRYIVTGFTYSFSYGESPNKDIWVLKLDYNGDIEWQKTYGGAGTNLPHSIQQTTDYGYIVAATTFSHEFGAGGDDIWILKLHPNGEVDWQKTYGTISGDQANFALQTSDGGYIVTGSTTEDGNQDIWILKLNSSGNVEWQKTYGGSWSDIAYSVKQTADSGYIVAAKTSSFGAGDNDDIWILKLDSEGNGIWQKIYGGNDNDEIHSIQQTSEGDYIAAGHTFSSGQGESDFWVLKLNNDGTLGCWPDLDASFVLPNNTAVSGVDTTISAMNSTAVVTDTDVIGHDSSAIAIDSCAVAPALSPPINVVATGGNSQVTIRWDTVSGAVSYNIYWLNSPSVTTLDYLIPDATSPYIHTGLTNEIPYYYVVTAENSSGESGISSEVSATPHIEGLLPSPPTNVAAAAGDRQVTITWDPVSGVTSYNLYWSRNPNVTISDDKISSITTPYIHAGLTNGTPYFYVVTAENSYGEGGTSSEVSATPQSGTGWAKTYGGNSSEAYTNHSIRQTSDGGYIVAGYTNSSGAGSSDIWVLKLDSNGSLSWEKTYGGSNSEYAGSIRQTSDGGYIVLGYTYSYGAGNDDIWVLKLNEVGDILWQKTYGEYNYETASSIQQTSDGGYILAGSTYSFGTGSYDIWVLKLDAGGNVSWQKVYGGSNYDSAYSIEQTSEGGYIVAGYASSFPSGNGSDIWVLKLDVDGNISWQKSYGGSGSDIAYSVQQTIDNGYIVAGFTEDAGNNDLWVLKLDSYGTVDWQKKYGGTGGEKAYSIQHTTDNGYVLAGYTSSFGNGDDDDIWVLKLDSDGNSDWQKRYGGTNLESGWSIEQTSEGGYIVAGFTSSFGAGNSDFWILKLNSNGDLGCQLQTDTNVIPNDTTISGTNTGISGLDTTAVITDTTITGQDSSAIIGTQCP